VTAGAAIVQDWLTAEAGAERVALEFARVLPTADLYTTFADPGLFGGAFVRRGVHTWPLQRLLGSSRHFRAFLPLYPLYFGGMDLRRYSLVISGSIAFTHAVKAAPGAVHVSYVYTPMRYAWDLDSYLDRSSWSGPARVGARTIRPLLQRWDRATASRPDVLVAISEEVRERIQRHWRRESEVIYPPVDVAEIPLSMRDDGFLLVAARMLAYRRLDVAVEACTLLGRDLVIVGDGPERVRLKGLAGPTVRFIGRLDRAAVLDLFARCHAYLVPGVEDFGIAPVEAMAAGKPVVGIRRGGVAETVVDGSTGVLFDRQDSRSLAEAIERLDGLSLDAATIRARAELFDTQVFRARWRDLFARLGVDRSLYSAE
jgi:glycosyltransferase involved in cell wall biosynthesis